MENDIKMKELDKAAEESLLDEVNHSCKNATEVLARVGGFGRFQQILVLLTSIMTFPATNSILIMVFAGLKPDWKCSNNSTLCTGNTTYKSDNKTRCNMERSDWEFTEHRGFSIVTEFDIYCEREWVIHLTTSIVFVGWGIGAAVWGWVSDNYGRKVVIFPTTLAIIIVSSVMAVSPNIWFLVACRFVSGFLIPGYMVQSWILIVEFISAEYRALSGLLTNLTFTICMAALPLQAWLLQDWKLLCIVLGVPYLFTLSFYRWVPESVRWLHIHGRQEEVCQVFKRVAYWNKKPLPDTFKISPIEAPAAVTGRKTNPLDIFRTRRDTIISLAQGYIWMVNGMVYYGLSLAAGDLGGSLYTNFTLMGIIEFPAAVLSKFTLDKMGRRRTTYLFMAVGGVSCIVVAFIPMVGDIRHSRVALGLLGKLSITITFCSVYIWSAEIYSTDIRAEGMAFLQITARVGAASSPWVAKALTSLHPTAPFIVMGSLAVAAAFACFPLPETNKKPIQDISCSSDTTAANA